MDDAGHVFEISKAPINRVFDIGMILVVLVELVDGWKSERSVDICSGGVIPHANISTNNFFSHDCLSRVLGGYFELKKDSGKVSQSSG